MQYARDEHTFRLKDVEALTMLDDPDIDRVRNRELSAVSGCGYKQMCCDIFDTALGMLHAMSPDTPR